MDRYSMNRNDMRYRNQRSYTSANMPTRSYDQTSCRNSSNEQYMDWHHHADQLPLAMAYIPMQRYHSVFEPCKALQVGTIFPELCKPFCGKRGGCK